MSLLEKDTTRKERVDENVIELDIGDDNSREYKVEAIWDSTVYKRESELNYLLGLYYRLFLKRYLEEKNT